MPRDVNIAGVHIAPFLIYACAAVPIFLVLRFIVARIRLLRWIWHHARQP
ncbi:hypothetical protein ABIF33_004899 [Bradyrhizobium elkanii]